MTAPVYCPIGEKYYSNVLGNGTLSGSGAGVVVTYESGGTKWAGSGLWYSVDYFTIAYTIGQEYTFGFTIIDLPIDGLHGDPTISIVDQGIDGGVAHGIYGILVAGAQAAFPNQIFIQYLGRVYYINAPVFPLTVEARETKINAAGDLNISLYLNNILVDSATVLADDFWVPGEVPTTLSPSIEYNGNGTASAYAILKNLYSVGQGLSSNCPGASNATGMVIPNFIPGF